MWEVSITTSLMNKQTLLEKAHWLPSDHRKNPSTPCSQLVALTVKLLLVIYSSNFSNSKNRRERAIPEYPLAWSSVLTTGLQKVGEDNNPNGKSLRIWKMLTTHRSKMIDYFLSHTSDFRSDTPPSSLHHLPWYYHSLCFHHSVASYYWFYTGSIVTASKTSGKWKTRANN